MTDHSSTWLNDYSKNCYSQNGEDGIIEKILEILPQKDNWCVEFGAWDGKYLSNTYHLIETYSYHAVLIEGDPIKFKELQLLQKQHDKIISINAYVQFEKNTLDYILKGTPAPKDFDVLSIDVDGNDYHIWQSISDYQPKVICIEYNPTIPNHIDFVQKKDMKLNHGNSLNALVRLGHDKGYQLIAVTKSNAIFVKEKYFALFGIKDNSLGQMRLGQEGISYIFHGYDGTFFLSGSKNILWQGMKIREKDIQTLPAFFRVYPDHMSSFKKGLFRLYKYLRNLNIF